MNRIVSLSPGEVHIWPIPLSVPSEMRRELSAFLNEDERKRTGRFLHVEHQERFMVGRGRSRQILAGYLGCSPGELSFAYSAHGKPFLADEADHGIRFNLSHSADQALLAVTRDKAIGVDLERIRPDFATDEIAQRFFSEREWQALREIPSEHRAEAFFRCWTRKEAFIKAVGEGLSYPLDAFAVSMEDADTARVRWIRNDPEAPQRWHLQELSAPPGFLAALAVEGSVEQVVLRNA